MNYLVVYWVLAKDKGPNEREGWNVYEAHTSKKKGLAALEVCAEAHKTGPCRLIGGQILKELNGD